MRRDTVMKGRFCGFGPRNDRRATHWQITGSTHAGYRQIQRQLKNELEDRTDEKSIKQ